MGKQPFMRTCIGGIGLLSLAMSLSGCFPLIATSVGAGTLLYADRRASETYIVDEGIETRTASRIREKYAEQAHVNVTSYNRQVLLTGEADTEAIRSGIEAITREVPNVKTVINELVVAPASSFAARGNDSYVTSKIKARFVDSNKFSANHVKVVTEAGIVYLLGIVTQAEADAAVDIARTTNGVRKVVRAMEIVPEGAVKPYVPPVKKPDDSWNKVPPGGSDPISG